MCKIYYTYNNPFFKMPCLSYGQLSFRRLCLKSASGLGPAVWDRCLLSHAMMNGSTWKSVSPVPLLWVEKYLQEPPIPTQWQSDTSFSDLGLGRDDLPWLGWG